MTEPRTTFYITTAIDYPNSAPHMGHAYEKVVADFYARCARLQGLDTRFLIGLDEHGQKIQKAADDDGKSPQDFVDEKAVVFRELYDFLEITHDDFIRTSEPRHHRFARQLYERVRDNGDIYKGVYEGNYCVSCENFMSEADLVDGKNCPVHGTPTQWLEEPSYFFRLGKYQEAVREHIEKNPEFVVPAERRNEILSRLEKEVLDLSISRSTFDWGIPLPDDADHVLYVWFDALSNYISALEEPDPEARRFWPASCHVIGKDILWFHTVIWPAMLLSAGITLPQQVYVHGFILDSEGRKMAKSLGNVVDPLKIAREYSVDVLRYYFLRAFSAGQDGRFSVDDLADRYHSELGNDLGNLVMRLSKLGLSRAGGRLEPTPGADDLGARRVAAEYFEHVARREHHRALDGLWSLVRRTNAYLNDKAPWKIADDEQVTRILYGAFEAMGWILHLLEPVMPEVSKAAAATLGVDLGTVDRFEAGARTYAVERARPLFPRRDQKSDKNAPRQPATKKKAPPAAVEPFAKLEIRVGRIVDIREHPDADSLYAMVVDLGDEKRSICAGLREHVEIDALRDLKVAVLTNLKPAVLRGIESRGMILAADRKDGKVIPVDPGDAAVGDPITVDGIESRPKKKLSKSDFEKAPLTVQAGKVTYDGKPLVTPAGNLVCDSEDGSPVR